MFATPNTLPSKNEWFRLPERENVKTDILKLPEGSWIETDRVIVRVGYYYQHHDMPVEELKARARQHILVAMNTHKSANLRRLLGYDPSLYDGGEVNPWGTFTEEHLDNLSNVLWQEDDFLFKQLYYQLRKKWLHEIKKDSITDEDRERNWLRTFYYVNTDPKSYQIHDYKLKQCGRYNTGGAYSYEEYEPPYLSQTVTQPLYEVGMYYNNGKYTPKFIHPLDCEQDKEKYI